ncbi:hypothetical protein JY551_02005 [Serratia marcescens]|nr:hypothetical protein [Serratia marcescens]
MGKILREECKDGVLRIEFERPGDSLSIPKMKKKTKVQIIATRLSLFFLRVAHPQICEFELKTTQVLALPELKNQDEQALNQDGAVKYKTPSVVLLSCR